MQGSGGGQWMHRVASIFACSSPYPRKTISKFVSLCPAVCSGGGPGGNLSTWVLSLERSLTSKHVQCFLYYIPEPVLEMGCTTKTDPV
jgi:hypothetical protein